ncbi:MAG: hypothetical protein Q8L29_02900 [archaeon]|nr:hypothetical protein [archaeon]
MVKGIGNKPLKGRNFALTILLGIFIAIMLTVLINLTVSYVYPGPEYDEFCSGEMGYWAGPYTGEIKGTNCSFNKAIQDESQSCINNGNTPYYEYDNNGCVIALKDCNDCQRRYDEAMKAYNKKSFFIFAGVGFIFIVAGLFVSPLLVQLALLPAGAILVIESAMNNFDSKLYVIIILTLLIVSAVYLALKKLR